MCAPRRHTVARVCVAVVAVAAVSSFVVPVVIAEAASAAMVLLAAEAGFCVVAVAGCVVFGRWYLRRNPVWKPPVPVKAPEPALAALPLPDAYDAIRANMRRQSIEGRQPVHAIVLDRKDEAWTRR